MIVTRAVGYWITDSRLYGTSMQTFQGWFAFLHHFWRFFIINLTITKLKIQPLTITTKADEDAALLNLNPRISGQQAMSWSRNQADCRHQQVTELLCYCTCWALFEKPRNPHFLCISCLQEWISKTLEMSKTTFDNS